MGRRRHMDDRSHSSGPLRPRCDLANVDGVNRSGRVATIGAPVLVDRPGTDDERDDQRSSREDLAVLSLRRCQQG